MLKYISQQNLKTPEAYGGSGQSCGCDISDYHYIKYLSQHYPSDLEKIYHTFPRTRFIIAEHEQAEQQ
ncbi:MAG: hypothetical protein IJV22_06230 [Bacteroidales bacterium]|nr:hypothetical protein [Bacteroidales bacterium]